MGERDWYGELDEHLMRIGWSPERRAERMRDVASPLGGVSAQYLVEFLEENQLARDEATDPLPYAPPLEDPFRVDL